jgi:hypothetical protein
VKGSTAALVALVGISSTAANALDWSINSSVSQSVELNDNQFLRPVPAGTVGSYTYLNSVFTAQTPTTRFDFTPDFTFRKYWGPGTEGQTLTQFTDKGLKLHFEDLGKVPGNRYYVDANWHQQDLAFALLNSLGLPSNTTGNINTTTASGGFDRYLTATDFFTLNAHGTSTDFQPTSAGTHFFDSSVLSNFRHQSNRTAALTASSEFEWLTFANAPHTNIYIWREMAGIDTQPSPRLSFTGQAGAAIVTTQQSQTVATPSATPLASGTAVGFIGNALLTYQLLSTTQLSFRTLQAISPSIVGSLTQLTSFDLTLRHTINQASTLSLSGDASRQTVAGGQTDFLSASATYSYQFAREWNAQLTYRFLHASGTTATSSLLFDPITGVPTPVAASGGRPANSNSILIVLTRNFTVLPRGT